MSGGPSLIDLARADLERRGIGDHVLARLAAEPCPVDKWIEEALGLVCQHCWKKKDPK